jgi:hypothetical protein
MNISLAEFVRERGRYCCEYCRMPQIYDEIPFELDHIVAEQHGGKMVASNLALACFADNRRTKQSFDQGVPKRSLRNEENDL